MFLMDELSSNKVSYIQEAALMHRRPVAGKYFCILKGKFFWSHVSKKGSLSVHNKLLFGKKACT